MPSPLPVLQTDPKFGPFRLAVRRLGLLYAPTTGTKAQGSRSLTLPTPQHPQQPQHPQLPVAILVPLGLSVPPASPAPPPRTPTHTHTRGAGLTDPDVPPTQGEPHD